MAVMDVAPSVTACKFSEALSNVASVAAWKGWYDCLSM